MNQDVRPCIALRNHNWIYTYAMLHFLKYSSTYCMPPPCSSLQSFFTSQPSVTGSSSLQGAWQPG